MAESGVLSIQEGSRSLPETELGGNRLMRMWISCRFCLSNFNSFGTQKLANWTRVSQWGQIPAFVFPKIVPLVSYVAVPRISRLAMKLKSTHRRKQNEAKY